MSTFADDRAAAVAAFDETADITPADVAADTEHARPGWTLWRAGRVQCHVPTLLPDAPQPLVDRYWTYVRAALTGQCTACGQVVGITGPSDPTSAAWMVLPIVIALVHEPECPARFTEDDIAWFDPTAWEAER